MKFFPAKDKFELLATDDNHIIRVWDLNTKKSQELDEHLSTITSLEFSFDKTTMVSTSRDKVFIVWDCFGEVYTKIKVVPVMDVLEGCTILSDVEHNLLKREEEYVVTAGEGDSLKVWNLKDPASKDCLLEIKDVFGISREFQDLKSSGPNRFVSVDDQNHLLFFDKGTLDFKKLVVTSSHEIIDVKWIGKTNDTVAVASATDFVHFRLFHSSIVIFLIFSS